MKDTFTMKELAAILVRRGKIVLIFAVVFALLLGGWQGIRLAKDAKAPENTPEQIEDRYLEALEVYQEEKAELEQQIANRKKQLEQQIAYNEESLLMNIDPLNKTVTTIYLMISGLNNEELNQVPQTESLPIDYAITRIQKQYALYWHAINLQEKLSDTAFSHINDKYIREITKFTVDSSYGSYMTIAVSADTDTASKQIAQTVLNILMEYQDTIAENSFQHQISLISQSTKVEIDEKLETNQLANREKVKTYQKELDTLEASLKNLTAPIQEEIPTAGTILNESMKYMILGAALGMVLCMIWVILSYLFRGRVELSRHLSQVLSVPMLGSTARPENLFDRLADRILGEQIWEDDTQAMAYLSASVSAHLPANATIALLSTLPISKESSGVQSIVETLDKQGFQVRFVEDASGNPLAVHAIQEGSCVILAERCGASNWNAIQEVATLAESLETPVKGFLLV